MDPVAIITDSLGAVLESLDREAKVITELARVTAHLLRQRDAREA